MPTEHEVGEEEIEEVPVMTMYTYPDDFVGRSWAWWQEVADKGLCFHFNIDPSCTEILGALEDHERVKLLKQTWGLCAELVKSMIVPDESSVIKIGAFAFYTCINLERITNGFLRGLVELEHLQHSNGVNLL